MNEAPSSSKPSPLAKRRGRPRSPVFAYFRRIVDDKGDFVGNQCNFCSFLSKDRSENPTYLTRHLLRTCTAPQNIKDAIGVRHPSIAIANYTSATRFVPPKPSLAFPTSTDPAVATVAAATAAATNAVNGRRTGPNKSVQHALHPQPPNLSAAPTSPRQQPSTHVDTPATASPIAVPTVSTPQPQSKSQESVATVAVAPSVPSSSPPSTSAVPVTPSPQKKQRQTSRSPSDPLVSPAISSTFSVSQPITSAQFSVPTVPPVIIQPPNATVPAPSAGLPAVSGGVTKTRRGRPKSAALMHFKRHIDDKGNFIANQCCFCPFVSRDRSENSTLLLRHLLSSSCSCPEPVKVALRGTKYTPDGKRLKKDGTVAESKSKKSGVGKGTENEVADGKMEQNGSQQHAQAAQGYAVNPGRVSIALVRFFRRHSIDLGTVESPLFRDLVQAVTATGPSNGVADQESSDQGSNDLLTKESKILPSGEELKEFWRITPHTQLLKSDPVSPPDYPPSTHLLVYFPYRLGSVDLRPSSSHYDESSGASDGINPALIASVFRWTADVELKYLGWKNCAGDLRANLLMIVEDAQEEEERQPKIKFDQVFISRPSVNVDSVHDIPRNGTDNVWIPDFAREVDMLCQELLALVPVLERCVRRNRLLASFFREKYSEGAAVVLFGRNAAEKERYNRYLRQISKPVKNPRCRNALEIAAQTYEIISQTQNSHENPQRLQETGSFLHTISEENSGNVQLCQEVTGLVLSIPYRKELEIFISVMTPLVNLISLYSPSSQSLEKGAQAASMAEISERVLNDPYPYESRSISQMVPDCLKTLRDLYADMMPEFDNDLRAVRAHTTCRLLGKGADGNPPIVDDICYVAAFLNPNWDESSTKGMSMEESWRRAAAFLHRHYSSSAEFAPERALEQMQSFHRRHGVFSSPELFNNVEELKDPREWWIKHGKKVPDLFALAMKVLNAPTSAFPIVQYIAETNAERVVKLGGTSMAPLLEKEGVVGWNLRLRECRVKEADGG